MDGLQAAPLQTLGRPGRGVSERRAERLIAAEVLARQVHVAVGAGEIELAAPLPPVFLAVFVGLEGAGAGNVDLDALPLRERVEIGRQLGQLHARALFLAEVGGQEWKS